MSETALWRKANQRRLDTCDQQHESSLEVALDYAAQGCAVFPCLPRSKKPATKRGFKAAATNAATIRELWLARPDYNVGVRTGAASGALVLDVDGSVGAATLHDLEARYGALPETSCSMTSAGFHLWFTIGGDTVPSSVARLGPGLDVRAEGGYVIAPPSVHPDGSIYRWLNSRPLASAPDWLLRLARMRPQPKPNQTPHVEHRYLGPPGAYGKAALEAEIDALALALRGTRNHALNRASFCLHQLVAGGELDADEVHDRLIAAAQVNGLMSDPLDGPRSAERTIASGARAGLLHPRNRGGAL
jgi:hypothetical protein